MLDQALGGQTFEHLAGGLAGDTKMCGQSAGALGAVSLEPEEEGLSRHFDNLELAKSLGAVYRFPELQTRRLSNE
ncbi:hypothetical protein QO010_000287 [Caulobacter ginsengisoli]|uniref:Uncharacterized protein n=1 Tax=Caulobacter ginsengisoli TaxID=400775 RepID=A0ABU0INE9_9CAUL|nr:hypothetical protein [Caulobacter ginsengisoli]MDQ0462539.1 hypothetical protein [Caulobacter ginsengisoli]